MCLEVERAQPHIVASKAYGHHISQYYPDIEPPPEPFKPFAVAGFREQNSVYYPIPCFEYLP